MRVCNQGFSHLKHLIRFRSNSGPTSTVKMRLKCYYNLSDFTYWISKSLRIFRYSICLCLDMDAFVASIKIQLTDILLWIMLTSIDLWMKKKTESAIQANDFIFHIWLYFDFDFDLESLTKLDNGKVLQWQCSSLSDHSKPSTLNVIDLARVTIARKFCCSLVLIFDISEF